MSLPSVVCWLPMWPDCTSSFSPVHSSQCITSAKGCSTVPFRVFVTRDLPRVYLIGRQDGISPAIFKSFGAYFPSFGDSNPLGRFVRPFVAVFTLVVIGSSNRRFGTISIDCVFVQYIRSRREVLISGMPTAVSSLSSRYIYQSGTMIPASFPNSSSCRWNFWTCPLQKIHFVCSSIRLTTCPGMH